MGSCEWDHCNNCLFWDFKNIRKEDERAECTKHKQHILGKGWCEDHIIRDPHDENDPSVKWARAIGRELIKTR